MTSRCLELDVFKECARHVWNVSFLSMIKRDRDIAFGFDKIEAELFEALVIRALHITWTGRYRHDPVPGLSVVLSPAFPSIPVMTCVETDPGKNKDWQVDSLKPDSAGRLAFISFFQWDTFGFLDWPLVECYDQINSRLVLVDQDKCKICYQKYSIP